MNSLRVFRDLIAEKDNDALSEVMDTISRDYEGWYNRRMRSDFNKGKIEQPDVSGTSIMGNMFGRLSFRRGAGDKDDDE